MVLIASPIELAAVVAAPRSSRPLQCHAIHPLAQATMAKLASIFVRSQNLLSKNKNRAPKELSDQPPKPRSRSELSLKLLINGRKILRPKLHRVLTPLCVYAVHHHPPLTARLRIMFLHNYRYCSTMNESFADTSCVNRYHVSGRVMAAIIIALVATHRVLAARCPAGTVPPQPVGRAAEEEWRAPEGPNRLSKDAVESVHEEAQNTRPNKRILP